MVWFRIDDGFYDHPKVWDASDSAIALWTRAGSWAARNLTDGFVPSGLLARFCGAPEQASRELVDRGLWTPARGGFRYHDWDEYNPDSDTVRQKRDDAKIRMRNLRARRREEPIIAGGDGNGSREQPANVPRTNRERSREVRHPPVRDPRPDPSLKESSNEDSSSPPVRRKTPTARGDPDFEAFYTTYPKRVGRKAAESAWLKAIKDTDPAAITAGAKRYADERRGENPQYTKQPSTWLNQGCWEDDPVPRTRGQPSGADATIQGLFDRAAAYNAHNPHGGEQRYLTD